MNAKIKIFVAGAKDLRLERDGLQAVANKLTDKYLSKGISVIAYSYEDFWDDQQAYNNFIKKEADIVAFVVDGQLGEKTLEEFHIAIDTYDNEKHPKVMVFMRDYGEQTTPQLETAKKIIGEKLKSKYYIEYKDTEQLKNKAKDRIDRYVAENIEEILKNTPDNKEIPLEVKKPLLDRIKLHRFVALSVFLIAMIIIGGMYVWHTYFPMKTLLLTGGSSAKNFIANYSGVNLNEYENSMNISLPSKSSWRILQEEVPNHDNDNTREFVTVCMSASKMDSSFIAGFEAVNKENDAGIVELFIGYDSLVVYASNYIKNNQIVRKDVKLDGDTISGNDLCKLIDLVNRDSIGDVFTTTELSGTLGFYRSEMEKHGVEKYIKDPSLIKEYKIFYETTNIEAFKGDKYLILGSRNYFVDALKKDVQKKKYKPYMLTFDGEYSKKPIYLYFVIYKDKKTGNFTVNETIKKFLEDINLTITGYYNGTGNDITAIYEKNPKNIVNDDSIAAKEWDDLLNGELNTRYNSFTGTIQKAK